MMHGCNLDIGNLHPIMSKMLNLYKDKPKKGKKEGKPYLQDPGLAVN